MSQQNLAAAADVSVDLIRKLEQGQRQSARLGSLAALANALDVQLAELIGKPRGLAAGGEDSEMLHLRRAVLDIVQSHTDPPELGRLRVDLGEAWHMYWAGQYAPLARQLPNRIVAVRAAARAASSGGHLRGAQALLADLLHLTASLLAHLGHDDLAALAMHQAMAAASASENPLMVAGLSASRAWLLSRQGLLTEAENLALATADAIEPKLSTASVSQVAIWGENLRYACVTLARNGRNAEATELLALLRTAAVRVGAERPTQVWTKRVADKTAMGSAPLAGLSFGPTLAAMTAVTVAAAADQHRKALQLQREVDGFESQSPAMQARHLLTIAWAQMAEWRSQEAVDTLRRVDALAPELLLHQTMARTIVAELLPRRGKQRLPGLVRLAERLGMTA